MFGKWPEEVIMRCCPAAADLGDNGTQAITQQAQAGATAQQRGAAVVLHVVPDIIRGEYLYPPVQQNENSGHHGDSNQHDAPEMGMVVTARTTAARVALPVADDISGVGAVVAMNEAAVGGRHFVSLFQGRAHPLLCDLTDLHTWLCVAGPEVPILALDVLLAAVTNGGLDRANPLLGVEALRVPLAALIREIVAQEAQFWGRGRPLLIVLALAMTPLLDVLKVDDIHQTLWPSKGGLIEGAVESLAGPAVVRLALLAMQDINVRSSLRLHADVLQVHGLIQLDGVPALALVVAVVERVGGDTLVAVPCQQQQAAVVAVLIDEHAMCHILPCKATIARQPRALQVRVELQVIASVPGGHEDTGRRPMRVDRWPALRTPNPRGGAMQVQRALFVALAQVALGVAVCGRSL
mmetsp:Transcript_40220/g.104106  ORF Transcript_40220/g.104106 Transcript_40220/m.104106 type:complete len:409 (-) Transcript_40220:1596-2822(-)